MANGDVIADDTGQVVSQVEDGVVLDVGVVADGDAVDVAPEHRVTPDARIIPQGHIAQHHRALGNIDALAKGGFLEQEPVELLLHQQPPLYKVPFQVIV
jgi:hypothetical protein